MKPIVLFRHKGFLIRVVDNGCTSHPYEWTIDGITPATKKLIREDAWRRKLYHKKIASMRRVPLRYDEFMQRYTRKSRLNNVLKRIYDPTSMPTARSHSCSAQGYAYDEVNGLLNPQKPYVMFTR
jgi:hypothetical protein